jgi:hypothetical protein
MLRLKKREAVVFDPHVGRVVEYSGVWRAGSMWWDKRWSLEEWDVEVENHGVYRLAKTESEWLITGEYD